MDSYVQATKTQWVITKSDFITYPEDIQNLALKYREIPEAMQLDIAKDVTTLSAKLVEAGPLSCFELYVRLGQFLTKMNKKKANAVKETPQWYCWSCRDWSKALAEPHTCPRCGGAMKRNGHCSAGWRD